MWLQEARVPHAPVSAWFGKNDMARGSHAPEGSRARGSACITIGGAWERVKRVGKQAEGSRARGSAWITMGGAWERVKRVGKRAEWFQSAWERVDHHRRRVGAREARRQTGRMVPERVEARGSPSEARGSA
jgi:hypothetical protein